MASLQGLREQLPPTDTAIPRLLQDAPVLPLPAVTAFLQEVIASGPEWAGMGLNAAYVLFESRPGARLLLLQLLLDAAVCANSPTRDKAVGLVVSKLMGWEKHAPAVLEFATQHLLMLLQPPPTVPPAASSAQQEEGGGGGQQQAAAANGVQQKQQQLEAAVNNAAVAGAGDGSEEQQQEQQQPLDVETAAQHSMLYLTLCTRQPELLVRLMEVYGKAGEPQAGGSRCRHMCVAVGSGVVPGSINLSLRLAGSAAWPGGKCSTSQSAHFASVSLYPSWC